MPCGGGPWRRDAFCPAASSGSKVCHEVVPGSAFSCTTHSDVSPGKASGLGPARRGHRRWRVGAPPGSSSRWWSPARCLRRRHGGRARRPPRPRPDRPSRAGSSGGPPGQATEPRRQDRVDRAGGRDCHTPARSSRLWAEHHHHRRGHHRRGHHRRRHHRRGLPRASRRCCSSRRRPGASAGQHGRRRWSCPPSGARPGFRAHRAPCVATPADRSSRWCSRIASSTTSPPTWWRASWSSTGSTVKRLGEFAPRCSRHSAYPRRKPGWRNGRRERLKTACPRGRGGSTPSPGTATLSAWARAAASRTGGGEP